FPTRRSSDLSATTTLTPTAAFLPCLCIHPKVAANCQTATSFSTAIPKASPVTALSLALTSTPAFRVSPCKSMPSTSPFGGCWRSLRHHLSPVCQPSSNLPPLPVMSPRLPYV